ncbi:MAG TPA: hypothetical protein VFP87_11990 [Chitinophagaceae bacterium]|nr:hypothetical protein [Chitinophagaceae bacterium]
MIRILTLMAIIFLMLSCNNRPATRTKTAADSLFDEVMDGHNKAMAKIARLHETQKRVQQMLDSFSKLPADIQRRSNRYKIQLDSALSRLKFADYAMEKWMNEFNMDSEANNVGKRIKYLESERIKISHVKDAVINSLQGADSLVKRSP